ncbi:MAG: phosphoribosylformylglycinamidine cyclo-ligase [Actinobacteria bacterium]|nr:phosphoribosylformylglycinamidine cyclo-ligase [Actinomycetota bacterium]
MPNAKRYEESGVNLKEASKTVAEIKQVVKRTFNDKVLTDLGSFAALFDANFKDYKNPVLVSSTDGVGTKIILHIEAGTYKEAGQDLVAMSSNDILTLGAKPLFFLDYIAGGKINSHVVSKFVEGMAEACQQIGAALIGGETAEMPGVYKEGDYDLSGFIVGIADKSEIPDASLIKPGDIVIGIESSGPHSNGFSLIRKIMNEKSVTLESEVPGTDKKFAELVLKPTILYHPSVLPLFEKKLVKSAANITGGGFYENIPRSIPTNVDVVIRKSSFEVPEIFKFIMKVGQIEEEEMFNVFNMGIGFIIISDRENENEIFNMVSASGLKCFTIGEVVEGEGKVRIVE